MNRRNTTTLSHGEVKDILRRLDDLIPETGYEASGQVHQKSCSVTYKFAEQRDVMTVGMSFYNFALQAPILARDLLVQLDELMSQMAVAE